MRIGLMGLNMGAACDLGVARDAAVLAEELGYDSVWVGDHPVLPSPPLEGAPFPPGHPFGAPLITLAYLAGHTTSVLLGTGVILVPQRSPVHLAKELATLDVLSGGRVLFGVGVGYLDAEFRAVGVPLAGRGARTDEYLDAIRQLWTSPSPAFAGSHVEFDHIEALPMPAHPNGPPIVVGGHSDAAFDRAARIGAGWIGWFLSPDQAARKITRLRQRPRPDDRGPLEITIMPAARLSSELVERYARTGVDRIVVTPSPAFDGNRLLRFVQRNAPAELGVVQAIG